MRRGFTLIELLIVVAIIAILAVIAVPNFLEAQTRTKVSRVLADMRSMATAIESYAADHNYYPLNTQLLTTGSIQAPQTSGMGNPAHKILYSGITTPVAYMTSLPHDPFAEKVVPPFPGWNAEWRLYFYTNLEWFRKLREPGVPPVIDQKRALYGPWILAGAGPDGDRLDLAQDIRYDPTNGTVSNGDVIFAPRR